MKKDKDELFERLCN